MPSHWSFTSVGHTIKSNGTVRLIHLTGRLHTEAVTLLERVRSGKLNPCERTAKSKVHARNGTPSPAVRQNWGLGGAVRKMFLIVFQRLFWKPANRSSARRT